MVIPALRRKVLRDLVRLWAQVLAIALVLAAGVATMILGNGPAPNTTRPTALPMSSPTSSARRKR